MRTSLLIFILLSAAFISAQTKLNIDTALFLKTNWVQSDDINTIFHHCKDCSPNKLVIYKDKSWGNIFNKHKDFMIGSWEIKGSKITLTFTFEPGPTTTCDIIELTKKSFIIQYKDVKNKSRFIKLHPLPK